MATPPFLARLIVLRNLDFYVWTHREGHTKVELLSGTQGDKATPGSQTYVKNAGKW
jgi:hypothetical protein